VSRPKTKFYYIAPALLLVALLVIGLTYKSIKDNFGCGCGDVGNKLGQFSSSEHTAYFLDRRIEAPLAELPNRPDYVLGDQTGDEKWIEVDLSDQTLRAWQGGEKYLETLVSTGKWNKTPIGEFRIWSKFKYIKMSGGSKEKGTYYYLPNVPFTMFFYKDFGIHGTYWHNSFGVPMSHGCINMPTPMAEKLFYWATPELPGNKNSWVAKNNEYGTRVVIHE